MRGLPLLQLCLTAAHGRQLSGKRWGLENCTMGLHIVLTLCFVQITLRKPLATSLQGEQMRL